MTYRAEEGWNKNEADLWVRRAHDEYRTLVLERFPNDPIIPPFSAFGAFPVKVYEHRWYFESDVWLTDVTANIGIVGSTSTRIDVLINGASILAAGPLTIAAGSHSTRIPETGLINGDFGQEADWYMQAQCVARGTGAQYLTVQVRARRLE